MSDTPDIVERLREPRDDLFTRADSTMRAYKIAQPDSLHLEAADEITRLRSALAALAKAADTLSMARERLEEAGYMQAAKDCAEDEDAARTALSRARGEST